MSWRVSLGACKDCGKPFPLTRTARELDVARGLSEPERCPQCRRINADAIRTRGAAYWAAPLETDDSMRCWGKFGLAKIIRDHPERELLPDRSVPIDLPLRDPESIADPRDRDLAKKFAAIAPAAEALVRNLEDPRGSRVSVLVGPTGTGKSTWVPYRILRSKVGELGRICVTQPRKITLRRADDAPDDATTPGFIARHLLRLEGGVGAGHEIGFQFSGEYDQQDRYTKLLYVTDGTLVRWLETGRVGQFDLVFIDEAHEQSANMELIFALLKYQLPRYPRLRVVIASATADVEKFRRYFGNGDPAGVFLAAPADVGVATPHPIHDRWLDQWRATVAGLPELAGVADPTERTRRLPDAIAATVRAICLQPALPRLGERYGDILAFLPTIAVVERARATVERMAREEGLRLDVLVSHAQMTRQELEAFKRSERAAQRAAESGHPTEPQRVILATNYAETSVTFSNLSYVIDSGLILEPDWDPRTCSSRYEPSWHSRAGCTQRKGRVGRVRAGECFRLYTEAEFAALQTHTPPEITRRPLDTFLLSAKAAGIEDLDRFDWLGKPKGDGDDQPHGREYVRSRNALGRRGTMDPDGDITRRGLELGGIQVSRVELAECLSEADSLACAPEMATFLAFIEQARSPFRRDEVGLVAYARWRAGCTDDLEFYLRLEQRCSEVLHARGRTAFGSWAMSEGLNPAALESIARSRVDNLRQFMRRGHDDPAARALDLKRLHRVRLVLAKCLPEWVYVRRADGEQGQAFVPLATDCPCGEPVEIDRDSACYQATDLSTFVCVERALIRSNRLLARHVVRVDRAWLGPAKASKPIGLALLLSDPAGGADPAESQRTASSVAAGPLRVDAGRYRPGQLLGRLRVLRAPASEEGERSDLLLSEDQETGYPVLVKPCSRVAFGTVLRAHVTDCDAPRGLVRASQEQLLAAYAGDPDRPLQGRVGDLVVDEASGEAHTLLVEIEPGIRGRLRRRDCDVRHREYLEPSWNGRLVEVCVDGVREGGDLNLVTVPVREGRKRHIGPGDTFEKGVIRDFYASKTGRRVAVAIELVPGQVGHLHERDVAARWDFATWQVGQVFPVVVASRNAEGCLQLVERAVHEARERPSRVGESADGIITGFDEKDGRRIGAFVEIRPGIDAYLPHGTRTMSYQDFSRFASWQARQSLKVVVDRVNNGRVALITTEVHNARGYQFRAGQPAIRGTVVDFDFGSPRESTPLAAFIELLPGRHGYLGHRALGIRGRELLSRLRPGAPIDVEIDQVQGAKISLRPWCSPIKEREEVRGYVTGFLEGRQGHLRGGAFIELRPGIDGLLHYREVSEAELLRLKVGDPLEIVVRSIERGASGKPRYSLGLRR